MPLVQAANFAQSALAGAISNTAVVANLTSGTGVLFPAPSNGQYFTLVLNDLATGLLHEIIHVIDVTGDTITMVRGQEGTTALNWNAGDLVFNFMTAGNFQLAAQVVTYAGNPNGNVAGVASGTYGPTLCWDTVDQYMWACITTGPIASAQWRVVGNYQPLSADLNLYVATTGNDGNDGLTPSTPFQTLQKAADTIQNYALNGHNVNVNVTAGTFVNGVTFKNSPNGTIVMQVYGGGTVTINVPNSNCVNASANSAVSVIGNFTLLATGTSGDINSGNAFLAQNGGLIAFSGVTFGACTNRHVLVNGGSAELLDRYNINGSASRHLSATGSQSAIYGPTIAANVIVNGTPNFSDTFAFSSNGANIVFDRTLTAFIGAATGNRYFVDYNAIIQTNGGGANYFPGSVAGSTGSHGAPVYS